MAVQNKVSLGWWDTLCDPTKTWQPVLDSNNTWNHAKIVALSHLECSTRHLRALAPCTTDTYTVHAQATLNTMHTDRHTCDNLLITGVNISCFTRQQLHSAATYHQRARQTGSVGRARVAPVWRWGGRQALAQSCLLPGAAHLSIVTTGCEEVCYAECVSYIIQ